MIKGMLLLGFLTVSIYILPLMIILKDFSNTGVGGELNVLSVVSDNKFLIGSNSGLVSFQLC